MRLVNRTPAYKPGLFWFSVFAMCWATLLLYAGAYTTSIQAGMAFLDWPLSNSSINPEGWLDDEDMRAEHSHRLLGAKLGLLAILMVIWTQLREARKGVRQLALGLLAMIIAQGLLGGLRVLFDRLNIGGESNLIAQTFAVLHAMGAQVTVCLLVSLAIVLSRLWIDSPAATGQVPRGIKTWGNIAVITIFVQILLGAVMRHAGAGLAIQTFPLTETGGLLPEHWTFPVTIHWLHRFGAVVTTVALVVFTGKILGSPATRKGLGPLAVTVLVLLGVQILLGAATIWTYKNPVMASNHMVVGAFLLASTWMLTFLSHGGRLVRLHEKTIMATGKPLSPGSESLAESTLKS